MTAAAPGLAGLGGGRAKCQTLNKKMAESRVGAGDGVHQLQFVPTFIPAFGMTLGAPCGIGSISILSLTAEAGAP